LHLGDRPEDTEFICAVLSALPKLTHFATDNDKLVLVSHTILELSPSLRVLVFFEYYSKEHTDKVAERLTRDVRFVCMWPQNLVDDQYAAIYGGGDYWSDAETFVAKHRSGEIDCECIAWTWAITDLNSWQRFIMLT
jgi:hypothetical protein